MTLWLPLTTEKPARYIDPQSTARRVPFAGCRPSTKEVVAVSGPAHQVPRMGISVNRNISGMWYMVRHGLQR